MHLIEIFAYTGVGLIVFSLLALLYLSFRQSFMWGMLCMIFSPIPFSFVYWNESKKFVALSIVGMLCFIPVILLLPEVTEEQTVEVTEAVKSAVWEKSRGSYFREEEFLDIYGSLVNCEKDVSVVATKNYLDKNSWPKSWKGTIQCSFTKDKAQLEVELKQFETGEWKTDGITYIEG